MGGVFTRAGMIAICGFSFLFVWFRFCEKDAFLRVGHRTFDPEKVYLRPEGLARPQIAKTSILRYYVAMANKEYLTQARFEELQHELKSLKFDKRKEIADELEFAKSLGDLSENAEYHEAREAQAALEDRISQLESILASAEIVSTHKSDTADIGSKVTVQKKGEKETRVYIIVGSEEIDTAAGKVSFKSPIGQALLGKKKGENFTVVTPTKEVEYTVVSIA